MSHLIELYAATLELPTDKLSADEIHKAYRRLVLKYHPDKNQSPEAKERASSKFIEIRKAYTFLMTQSPKVNVPESKNLPIIINTPLALTHILHGCILKRTITRVRTTSDKRKHKELKMFEIKIDRGTLSGTKFHFQEEGNQLYLESPPGDVIFIIVDKPNSIFKRVKQVHLEYIAPISQRKYLSGGVVEIPTLENKLEWKRINAQVIKQGCVRISGRGLPFLSDPTKRGDLIVRFKVNVDLLIKLERFMLKFCK